MKALLPAIILFASTSPAFSEGEKTPQTFEVTEEGMLKETDTQPDYQVSILSDVAEKFNAEEALLQATENVDLKNIRLAVDSDNITLEELINDIITKAEEHTGPWKVKWRLKPENEHILNQRVNLIAEGTFGEFTYHLTDRIKNMTGTQLFLSHFDAARVIVISDTVY